MIGWLCRLFRPTHPSSFILHPFKEPPPAPPGWTLVATLPNGDASYEASGRLGPRPGELGPGVEFCGVNSAGFHGFPAGTLSIGSVGVHMAATDPVSGMRLKIRFDYRPGGWPSADVRFPSCDFNRLPFQARMKDEG